MYAVRVVLDNLGLRTRVPAGRLLTLAVALAAKFRHVLRKRWRGGVFLGLRSMSLVAVQTLRSIGIAIRKFLAMNTGRVLFYLILMADGTVHRGGNRLTRPRQRGRRAGVALRTANGGVC